MRKTLWLAAGVTATLLATHSLQAKEVVPPGAIDGQQLAQRKPGFYGFPGWDSRSGRYDRSRLAEEKQKDEAKDKKPAPNFGPPFMRKGPGGFGKGGFGPGFGKRPADGEKAAEGKKKADAKGDKDKGPHAKFDDKKGAPPWAKGKEKDKGKQPTAKGGDRKGAPPWAQAKGKAKDWRGGHFWGKGYQDRHAFGGMHGKGKKGFGPHAFGWHGKKGFGAFAFGMHGKKGGFGMHARGKGKAFAKCHGVKGRGAAGWHRGKHASARHHIHGKGGAGHHRHGMHGGGGRGRPAFSRAGFHGKGMHGRGKHRHIWSHPGRGGFHGMHGKGPHRPTMHRGGAPWTRLASLHHGSHRFHHTAHRGSSRGGCHGAGHGRPGLHASYGRGSGGFSWAAPRYHHPSRHHGYGWGR